MSIPKNASITELRERLQARIDKHSGRTTDFAKATVERALSDLAKLDELSKPTSQRAHYSSTTGAEWNKDYLPVREMRSLQIGTRTGTHVVEELWRTLPNSRFKRFQEIFTPADLRCVPRPGALTSPVQFPSRRELNNASLQACIVDPGLVSNKLVQDLGLVQWPNKTPSAMESLLMKSEDHVIQGLKMIWESTATLDSRNNRILVVRPIKRETQSAYPAAIDLPPELVGALIDTREDSRINTRARVTTTSEWNAPRKIASFFPTIYAAYRKSFHETSGYEAETKELSKLRSEWNDLRTRIRSDWREGASGEVKQKLRNELKELVKTSLKHLDGASNYHKAEARDFVAALAEQLNSDDKAITRMLARAVAIADRMHKRLGEMPHRNAANETDRLQLLPLITASEHKFDRFSARLFAASGVLKEEMVSQIGFFKRKIILRENLDAEVDRVLERIGLDIGLMDGMHVRPFTVFAQKIKENYADLRKALYHKDPRQATEAIVKMVAVSKLQLINARFEELRLYTSEDLDISLDKVTRVAKSLRHAVELRSVFPEQVVSDFEPTYKELQKAVKRLATGLERYETENLDLTARRLMYKKLRVFLDKHDVEDATRRLPR